MEIEIRDRIEEKLLNRERINFILEFDGPTPSVIEVRKLLATKLAADIRNLVVRRIYNEYGVTRAKGYAYLYNSPEDLQKNEPDFIKKKNKIGEELPEEQEKQQAQQEQQHKDQEDQKKEEAQPQEQQVQEQSEQKSQGEEQQLQQSKEEKREEKTE